MYLLVILLEYSILDRNSVLKDKVLVLHTLLSNNNLVVIILKSLPKFLLIMI